MVGINTPSYDKSKDPSVEYSIECCYGWNKHILSFF